MSTGKNIADRQGAYAHAAMEALAYHISDLVVQGELDAGEVPHILRDGDLYLIPFLDDGGDREVDAAEYWGADVFTAWLVDMAYFIAANPSIAQQGVFLQQVGE